MCEILFKVSHGIQYEVKQKIYVNMHLLSCSNDDSLFIK